MLLNILAKYKKLTILYLVNGIIQTLAASLSVVYFQRLIDSIPLTKDFNKIMLLLTAYGGFMILDCILSYADEYPARALSNGIYQKLKLEALNKISKVDYSSYQNIGTGKLIQLVENGSNAGRKILFDFYLNIFRNLLPSVIISLIFIGVYSTGIMAAIIVGYILIFFISNLLLKYLYKIKDSILTHEEWLSKRIVRGFMELVVFRVNNRFENEINKISKVSDHVVRSQTKIRMIHELFFALFALIVIGIKLYIVITGVSQVVNGKITIGAIIALISFTDRIYTPIAIFNVIFIDYKLDKVTYNRFRTFINMPDDENLYNGECAGLCKGSISFDNVSFSYNGVPVLENIKFCINGGSSAAIVGPSGAGKSTIIKIILGLLKPTDGKVLVDGIDLQKVMLCDYYRHISYVSQDAPIFDGTLRENIILDETVSDEEIYFILEQVKLNEFIDKLPDKLDTEVGEKGIKLSGGEKQRLAIARVFFQKPKIVILDEPTSALDSITEELITNYVLSALKDRTIIIIAHRLQTVKNVDEIIVVKDGKVAEQGKFDTLIMESGVFSELWKKQTKPDMSKLNG